MSHRVVGRAGLSGLQTVAPAVSGRRVNLDVPLAIDRMLALPGEVLVAPGDHVDPDTSVARALDVPARLHLIDLSPVLTPPYGPDDVRSVVCVRPGDPIRQGQAVARVRSSGWMGQGVREITAPADGVVEFVSLGRAQIVLRSPGDEGPQRLALHVAAELGIEPGELPRHLKCRPGQAVEVGDLLARGPGIGVFAREFRSPVSGVVESASPLSGAVTVFCEPRTIVLRAYLQGCVDSVLHGYGARIVSRGHRISGILGLGGKSWGRLRIVEPREPAGGRPGRLQAADIAPELGGCVLLFRGEVTAGALEECRRQAVRGVVAASARAGQLARYAGRPLAAEIVTGPGSLALPGEGRRPSGGSAEGCEAGPAVVLTEGLGSLEMDREIYRVLAESEGTIVSMDGLTQIRAGVVRPVVLLPLGPGDGVPAAGAQVAAQVSAANAGVPGEGSQAETAQFEALPAEAVPAEAAPARTPLEIQVGMRVRLVRSPYFGCWGEVLIPPTGLTRLETEVEARVVRVRLDDGRTVAVAEANVEL